MARQRYVDKTPSRDNAWNEELLIKDRNVRQVGVYVRRAAWHCCVVSLRYLNTAHRYDDVIKDTAAGTPSSGQCCQYLRLIGQDSTASYVALLRMCQPRSPRLVLHLKPRVSGHGFCFSPVCPGCCWRRRMMHVSCKSSFSFLRLRRLAMSSP